MNQPTLRQTPLARAIATIVTILIIVGVAIWLWTEVFRPRLGVKNLALVEPGLYRSGQMTQHIAGPALREMDIDVIIAMSLEREDHPGQSAEVRAAEALGIERHVFPLAGDGTGDSNAYVDALVVLVDAQSQQKTTLVHCTAGAQRTSGVIALYQVLFQARHPASAVAEMRRHRHDPTRNTALIPYLNANIGDIAAGLVERGVLAQVPDPLPQFPTR